MFASLNSRTILILASNYELIRNPDALVTSGDLWAFAGVLEGVEDLPATSTTAQVQYSRTGLLRLLDLFPDDFHDFQFSDRILQLLRQALALGRAQESQAERLFHEFAKQQGLLEPFPLLRLPTELRNIIYGLAMPAGETFTIASACHPDVIQPAIIKISRQVRLEALSIFYSENEFDFHAFRYNFDHLLQYLTFVYCWAITEIGCIHITLRQTTWGGTDQGQEPYVVACGEGL
ncbi:hypothetical protein LTR17_016367 [Elasticomyces elasticus]|nr:hypothetical protein LTR17_016367 [Elasticomyces elasticus]